MQEMPLLIFTILEQTAIGALITLLVLQFAGKVKENRTIAITGLIIACIGIVAMLVSLGHLGQPMRAFNALRGLDSSWLSREILFFGLFVGATIIYAILAFRKKDAPAKVLGVVAAIFGVLSILPTSLSYMMPGVPAWNGPTTPLQFVLTVIVCGIPLAMALVKTLDKNAQAKYWWIAFIILLISQVAMRWFFFADITLLINMV